MSISQPPAQDKGKSGKRSSGAPSGSGPGRSGNGSSGGSRSPGGQNRQGQRNPSQKTAGNRQVDARAAGRSPARGAPNRTGVRPVQQNGRGPGRNRQPVAVPSRRLSPTALGGGAVAVVIVVVLVIVLIGVNHKPATKPPAPTQNATASLVQKVTSVPASVFTKVGLPSEIDNYPLTVSGQKPLTDPGTPVFLYEGAEYCPFCAAERWSMIMALSRFGTFSGLRITFSSTTDSYPDTATFSFSKATYKSQYVVFRPYELATNEPAASSSDCNVNGYACLETPPSNYAALLEDQGSGSFPFMDFGNKLIQAGAAFGSQPQVLAGLTQDQIAADLTNPSSPVTQAEVGSANYLTAALCTLTGDQPSTVCSSSMIKSAQTKEKAKYVKPSTS